MASVSNCSRCFTFPDSLSYCFCKRARRRVGSLDCAFSSFFPDDSTLFCADSHFFCCMDNPGGFSVSGTPFFPAAAVFRSSGGSSLWSYCRRGGPSGLFSSAENFAASLCFSLVRFPGGSPVLLSSCSNRSRPDSWGTEATPCSFSMPFCSGFAASAANRRACFFFKAVRSFESACSFFVSAQLWGFTSFPSPWPNRSRPDSFVSVSDSARLPSVALSALAENFTAIFFFTAVRPFSGSPFFPPGPNCSLPVSWSGGECAGIPFPDTASGSVSLPGTGASASKCRFTATRAFFPVCGSAVGLESQPLSGNVPAISLASSCPDGGCRYLFDGFEDVWLSPGAWLSPMAFPSIGRGFSWKIGTSAASRMEAGAFAGPHISGAAASEKRAFTSC